MRSPSLSSDVPSTRSAATAALPEANPPPSFVATAEASQLVSSEVDDIVNVKEQALLLLNSFLDHILYNILSTAKSVGLAQLRAAVPVVLKPRLGKAALGAADEELKEYLNDGDNEALIDNDPRSAPGTSFNLDLAWKLARLRCMVYTRLGDMEEEDEEEHIEAEQLHPGIGAYTHAAHRASSVRAASAIFLTSILEYLGEQALLYAVQNTQRRAQAPQSSVALQFDKNSPISPPIYQSMVLDESDMFYVGRESPLSRLWRSWRRQTRLPIEMASRQISPFHDEQSPITEKTPRIDENAVQEDFQDSGLPHQVPLPMSDNDVNEIEVPGLAREIVDDGEVPPAVPVSEHSKKRPASMIIHSFDSAYQSVSTSPRTMTVKQDRRSRPFLSHHRSMSHPTPEKQTYSRTSNAGLPPMTNVKGTQDAEVASLQHPTSDVTAEAAPGISGLQHEEEEEPKEGHATSGLVATVVSAAAGALGFGALASARDSKGKELAEHQSKSVRTAADETIGSTTPVPQPTDTATGLSITSEGNLDNPYVPVVKPNVLETPESNSRLDSSDPEDLALSSADEDASEIKSGIPGADSRLSRNGDSTSRSSLPPNPENSKAKAPVLETSDDSGRISEATNGEEMGFTTSEKGAKEVAPLVDHEESDRPLYAPVDRNLTTEAGSARHLAATHGSSSQLTTGTGLNGPALSPSNAQSEREVAREHVISRPNTATTTLISSVPPRLSSDRSGSAYAHTDSRTSRYSQDSKRSSSSSKLLGFTRDHEGRPQTGTAYAPVLNGAHDYTSSSTEAGRELHSSGSRSAKGPLTVETSAGLENDIDKAEAKKKSLDILIRGDETLHYTLTPVSARGEDFPIPAHSPNATRNLSSRDGYSSGHPAVPTNSNAISGLRANPMNETAPSPAPRKKTDTYESTIGGIASSPPAQAKPRINRAQPRDPRLDNNTMMDLADYARSTGPENEKQLPKALSSRPGTSTTVKTVKSISNTIRTMPVPLMPSGRPTTQQSQGSKSVATRTRFQAREPTVSRKSGTNDLIEFLREGPPSSAGVNGNFSTGEDRASAASTQNSSVAPRSIQESMNSSTALLASNRAQQKKLNGATSNRSIAARNAPLPQRDTMPARKQRRARDPYAIDDSDDDVEEPLTGAQAKRTQDESLIDFLRNTAPPPGSSPPPILAGPLNGASSTAAGGAVRGQTSNQGIRERIMRSASRSSLNRKPSVNHSQSIVQKDEPSQHYRSTGQARETSPHLVQRGKNIDIYKPTTVIDAQHVNRLQARGPTSSSRTNTADLADYLKHSGPPNVPAGGPVRHPSVLKEEAGFLRFFSRRKAMK